MIATTTTHVQDLEASLENAFTQQTDCQTQVNHQQSLLTNLQAERATFEQRQAAREQEQAAFRPQVQEASAMLVQAQDYAKAASGSIKNAALDQVLAAEELHNEMRSQLLGLVQKHQAEQEVDQPFIDEVESKIRSCKLSISQLQSEQEALAGTRKRLHAELGQAILAYYSAVLRHPREKKERLETEAAQNDDIYARQRREAFERLSEWPELKRKLQGENSITDNGELKALLHFAAFCEVMAAHPIADTSIVELFILESYSIMDMYDGHSSARLFEEKAQATRMKIAELNQAKR